MGRLGLLDECTNGEDLVSYRVYPRDDDVRGGVRKYGGAAGRKDYA